MFSVHPAATAGIHPLEIFQLVCAHNVLRRSSSKLSAKTCPLGAVELTVPRSGSSAVRCSSGDHTEQTAVLFTPCHHTTTHNVSILQIDMYLVPDKRFVVALDVSGCNATGLGTL